MNAQRGQILAELLLCLALLTVFIAFSITFFAEYDQASYRFLLTQPAEKK